MWFQGAILRKQRGLTFIHAVFSFRLQQSKMVLQKQAKLYDAEETHLDTLSYVKENFNWYTQNNWYT